MKLNEENIFFIGGAVAIMLIVTVPFAFGYGLDVRGTAHQALETTKKALCEDLFAQVTSGCNPVIFSATQNRQITFLGDKPAHFLLVSGNNPFYMTDDAEIHMELFASGYQYLHLSSYKENDWKPEALENLTSSEYFIEIWSDGYNTFYVLKWYKPIYDEMIG